MNLPALPLQEVAATLELLAAGHRPTRPALLAGALALQTLCIRVPGERDLLDAAAGLETLATGGTLDLDEAGRRRAAHLATLVRKLADAA